MAILIHTTVEGDSEEWFWAVARVQKVEQLNAALALLLWLLHIQQVTHFFFLQTPLPHTNWCFLVVGVGFLVEGKETFFSLSAGWFTCIVRRSTWLK